MHNPEPANPPLEALIERSAKLRQETERLHQELAELERSIAAAESAHKAKQAEVRKPGPAAEKPRLTPFDEAQEPRSK